MATNQNTGTYRRAPEEKRERLLAAARTLFAKQGFEDTSTQQIARMAGVSEGILFHHFGSKKALFEAIAEDFVRAGAQAAIPPDAAHLTEEVVVRAAFDFADANPALYRMLARVGATLGDPDMTARSEIIVDAIRKNLEDSMARGMIRRGDPRIMAQLQFAVVDAAYKAWLGSGDDARREDYIREAVSCMKAMLAPEKQDRPPADGNTNNPGDDS